MAENYAEYRGEQGEKRVCAMLNEMASLGYRPLHNLLLVTSREKSTQIDHLIIDRFGILVIETKNIGGLLKGTSADKNWTVCYPDGKKRQMFSPIEQNELHRKRLHQFLLAQGMQLRDNYVQSLVVFTDGRLDALELSPEDRMRVTTLEKASEFLRARYDFQPNEGALTELLIEDYAAQLHTLDRSADPEAVARHLEQAKAAKAGGRSRARRRDSRPSRRYAPAATPRTASAESFGHLLGRLLRQAAFNGIGVVVALLVAFLLMSVGVPLFVKAMLASGAAARRTNVTAPAPVSSADAALAYERLREAAPDIAAAVTNKDTPRLGTERGLTTYTWEYLRKGGTGSVEIKTVSIALDASGRIVGAP